MFAKNLVRAADDSNGPVHGAPVTLDTVVYTDDTAQAILFAYGLDVDWRWDVAICPPLFYRFEPPRNGTYRISTVSTMHMPMLTLNEAAQENTEA